MKAAIVTGAGSTESGVSNGQATSVVLAREGWRVVLVDRDPAALETTAIRCKEASASGAVITVVGDVVKETVVEAAVAAAAEEFGGIDAVINNVGVFGPESGIAGVDADEWAAAMTVNVTSIGLTAKYAVPYMRRRGRGAIVNLASVAALAGTGNDSLAYAASKGAVVSLTRQLASRHGPDGIRVNCVAPGMVDTPMVAGRIDDAGRERMRMACPLRTVGTAWDVAEAVAFLADDRSRWISGVTLPVDGGLMAVVPSTEGVSG